MVREVNISSFVTHSNRFDANSTVIFSSTFLASGKFVDFRQIFENSENAVSETLFSEGNI